MRAERREHAAQIAAASLGGDQEQFRQWLNDPKKLLELIAAAQVRKAVEFLGQARRTTRLKELRALEIPVQPDTRSWVSNSGGTAAAERALGLGQVQAFGPQTVAVGHHFHFWSSR